MRRSIAVLASSVLLAPAARAQTKPTATAVTWADSAGRMVERAQIASDLTGLRNAQAVVERALVVYPDDALLLHYLGFAFYRESMVLLAQGQSAPSAEATRQASDALERSLARRQMPETHALLSTVDGRLIANDASLGPTLGMESMNEGSEAITEGPSNPRVWLIRGMNTLYTPTEYGGGVAPATKMLEHAVELFATDHPAPGEPAWGKAEVHAWLGQAYQQSGDAAKALAEYKKALALEPTYSWVEHALIPSLGKIGG